MPPQPLLLNFLAQGLWMICPWNFPFVFWFLVFVWYELHLVLIFSSLCSFVARIFGHALEDSNSKSGLVYSLSVCISLLDPKRSVPSPMLQSFRGQHMYESPAPVNPATVGAMLPQLGKCLIKLAYFCVVIWKLLLPSSVRIIYATTERAIWFLAMAH